MEVITAYRLMFVALWILPAPAFITSLGLFLEFGFGTTIIGIAKKPLGRHGLLLGLSGELQAELLHCTGILSLILIKEEERRSITNTLGGEMVILLISFWC